MSVELRRGGPCGRPKWRFYYAGGRTGRPYNVIASQSADWRGNPFSSFTGWDTDSHTSDVGHWFGMTGPTESSAPTHEHRTYRAYRAGRCGHRPLRTVQETRRMIMHPPRKKTALRRSFIFHLSNLKYNRSLFHNTSPILSMPMQGSRECPFRSGDTLRAYSAAHLLSLPVFCPHQYVNPLIAEIAYFHLTYMLLFCCI